MITLLKSKLHNATVTSVDLDYEGSCVIDAHLMSAANIREYEQIHIFNKNNGARFITYAIASPVCDNTISVQWAAAKLVTPLDKLIICTFGIYSKGEELDVVKIYLGENNKIVNIKEEYIEI